MLDAIINASIEYRNTNVPLNDNENFHDIANDNIINDTDINDNKNSHCSDNNNKNNIDTINQNRIEIDGEKQVENFNLQKKRKRQTCCSRGCANTSTNAPKITFSRVPPMPINKINDKSSDEIIHTYFRKKFIRKEWMRRLGLVTYNTNQHLLVCSDHNIELQETEYTYKNKQNVEILAKKSIAFPRHENDPPLKTRMKCKKRKFLKSYF